MTDKSSSIIGIKITPDDHVSEVSQQQEIDETTHTTYSGYALQKPEHWEHKKFRLTMTMPDLFADDDQPNILATIFIQEAQIK